MDVNLGFWICIIKWLNKLEEAAWLLSLILSIQGFRCKNLKYYKRKKVAAAQEQREQEWKSRNKKKNGEEIEEEQNREQGRPIEDKIEFFSPFF